MSFNLKVGGTWQELASLWAKVSGTWQQVQSAWVKVSGTWQQVYINFTASASDTTPSGSASGPSSSGLVTSNSTTVTPVGGTAPYTYSWVLLGGAATSGPFDPSAPTAATTAWSETIGDLDPDITEVWRCTVTDDDSNTTTVDVTVTLEWTDTAPP